MCTFFCGSTHLRPQVSSGDQEQELPTGKKIRLGIYITEKHGIRHSIELAKLAEKCGFEAVWQGEEYPPFTFARESIIPLAAIAAVDEDQAWNRCASHLDTERDDPRDVFRDAG